MHPIAELLLPAIQLTPLTQIGIMADLGFSLYNQKWYFTQIGH